MGLADSQRPRDPVALLLLAAVPGFRSVTALVTAEDLRGRALGRHPGDRGGVGHRQRLPRGLAGLETLALSGPG